MFLNKIYNNQNQEGFIICQKQHIRKVGRETGDVWWDPRTETWDPS